MVSKKKTDQADANKTAEAPPEKKSVPVKKLYCVKSGIYMPEDKAKCPTPNDYCKTRTACIINLISKEYID